MAVPLLQRSSFKAILCVLLRVGRLIDSYSESTAVFHRLQDTRQPGIGAVSKHRHGEKALCSQHRDRSDRWDHLRY